MVRTERRFMKTPQHRSARALLGHRVREIRRRQGKTLTVLGGATGLSKSTLSKIENGALSVSYDNLLKLAHALSADISELLSDGASVLHATGRRTITRRGNGEVYETSPDRYELLGTDTPAFESSTNTRKQGAVEALRDMILKGALR